VSRGSALSVGGPHSDAWPPAPVTRAASALHLGGISLRLDLSCMIGSVLTAWTFASGFLPETDPGRTTTAYWTAGLVGALLVATSLLIHELGHAVAARRAGLDVARITLSFIGGTTELVGVVRRPAEELVIALGGPLASMLAALAASLVHVVIVEAAGPGLPATVAALIAVANLAVAVLNVIPGLPLDGGRVLRALVWAATGRTETATNVATILGRRLGEITIGVAVMASAFGFLPFALWAGLLGFVLRDN
jgi:Zn-dependent protease